MRLLAVYLVFVVVGVLVAYGVGRGVEIWSQTASLPVFLGGFFAAFWAAWKLAVRVT